MIAICLVVIASASAYASGQQLLDRVAARVEGYAITLSDVRAAVALGLVDLPAGAGENEAVQRLIDRQLMLSEVARFAPPEPAPEEMAREMSGLRARVGGRLATIMDATGLDETRIREMVRDNLRIEAYLDQRFGTAEQLTEEEVLQYYRIRPEEFTRDERLMPFAEAEPLARQRAAAQRRAAAVAQWLRDLRARTEVVLPRP